MSLTRRDLLKSAALTGVFSTMPAGMRMAFAAPGDTNNDVLIVLGLRGGMDALNFLAPVDDANYLAARGAAFRVGNDGLEAANALTNQNWRFHPDAAGIKRLYDAGHLAIVQSAGLTADSRSHFQAADMLDCGVTTPGQLASANGWITRHLTSKGATGAFTGLSTGAMQPLSWRGYPGAISIGHTGIFEINNNSIQDFVRASYGASNTPAGHQGALTIDAVNAYNTHKPPGGVGGNSQFEVAMNIVSQVIKMDVGLQVATVDFGDWDTHANQSGRFWNLLLALSTQLENFFNGLVTPGKDFTKNVTVVTMSEFGRRVASDMDGTDHGHGQSIMVLGGNVNGGKMYGQWKGLHPSVLDLGDLPITTDYRDIVSEILRTRCGNSNTAAVFPGLTPAAPLGLVRA